MPLFCAVVGCSKRGERDKVRFFRIPAALKGRGIMLDALSLERRECWIKALKRENLGETFLKNARICSCHFLTGQPADLLDRNNPDWIPSKDMGYVGTHSKKPQAVERHTRSLDRGKRLKTNKEAVCNQVLEPMETGAGPSAETEKPSTEQDGKRSVQVQTDWDMDFMRNTLQDIEFCNKKIAIQTEQLKSLDLSEESIMIKRLSILLVFQRRK